MDYTDYARMRDRVRLLEDQTAHLFRHLGLDPADVPAPATDLDPEVVELINDGKKIHAIKLHRERTGLGLREASTAIDEYEQRYSLGQSTGA